MKVLPNVAVSTTGEVEVVRQNKKRVGEARTNEESGWVGVSMRFIRVQLTGNIGGRFANGCDDEIAM